MTKEQILHNWTAQAERTFPNPGKIAQDPEQLVFRGGDFAAILRRDSYELGSGLTCDLADYSTDRR